MILELNVSNVQKHHMGLDDMEHSILNWVGNLPLEEVEFDHGEEFMSCMHIHFA